MSLPKGFKHSEETKIKISQSEKGKVLSEETKKKLSISMKEQYKNGRKIIIPKLSGEKHYMWKGGQTKEERDWQKNKRNRLKRMIGEKLGGHSFHDWEKIKKQYNFTCPCCKVSEPEIKLTEDHIIPLSCGGSDLIENIQPLCKKCNVKKMTKTIKY